MADAVSQGSSSFNPPNKGNVNRGNSAPAQSLGALLRQRREAMGVSLAEVEVATRIRQKYLAAIESDDWHLLPGEVVGRGFLRNYSAYLGLEPHEVVDRRRAVTDPGLVAALSTTSSGALLPPERQVDYRPKEVDLKDDVDGIQRGEIRLTPILSIVAVAALVALAWLATTRLRQPIVGAYDGVQTRVAQVSGRDVATATPALIGIVNSDNLGGEEATAPVESADVANPPPGGESSAEGAGGDVPAAVIVLPTNTATLPAPTDTPVSEPPTPTPEPPTPEPPTPTPEPPTPEPPTPTFTPEPPTPEPELPTDTPAPPPVLAAACADGRSVITAPGVNQVVSGVLTLAGTATHGNLDYYKLEYAPGANAAGGFVYFDGQSGPVEGGALGSIDTRNLPNGEYTLRITVVDQTGNFPPPCDVTVVVQN